MGDEGARVLMGDGAPKLVLMGDGGGVLGILMGDLDGIVGGLIHSVVYTNLTVGGKSSLLELST